MNIKSRIEKIETKTKISGYCDCFRFNEFYDFLQNGGKPAEYYKFMPDICQTCRKRVDKSKEKEFLAYQKIADERLRKTTLMMAKRISE